MFLNIVKCFEIVNISFSFLFKFWNDIQKKEYVDVFTTNIMPYKKKKINKRFDKKKKKVMGKKVLCMYKRTDLEKDIY